MLNKILRLALFLSLFTTAAVMADSRLVFDLLDKGQSKAHTTMLISSGKIRLDSTDDSDTYMLFDNQSKAFYVINSNKKSYTVMDQAMINQMVALAEKAKKQLEIFIKNAPPEQKEAVKAMASRMFPQAETKTIMYKSSGKKQKVHGNICKVTQVVINGVTKSEVCLAKPADINLNKADAETLFGFQEHMLSLAQRIPNGPGNEMPWGDPVMRLFPLKMVKVDNGKKTDASQIREIDNSKIAASLFELPQDYVESKMLKR